MFVCILEKTVYLNRYAFFNVLLVIHTVHWYTDGDVFCAGDSLLSQAAGVPNQMLVKLSG